MRQERSTVLLVWLGQRVEHEKRELALGGTKGSNDPRSLRSQLVGEDKGCPGAGETRERSVQRQR